MVSLPIVGLLPRQTYCFSWENRHLFCWGRQCRPATLSCQISQEISLLFSLYSGFMECSQAVCPLLQSTPTSKAALSLLSRSCLPFRQSHLIWTLPLFYGERVLLNSVFISKLILNLGLLTLNVQHGRIPAVIKMDMPSSSRGLGRSPLKAETGVRIPVGVPRKSLFS